MHIYNPFYLQIIIFEIMLIVQVGVKVIYCHMQRPMKHIIAPLKLFSKQVRNCENTNDATLEIITQINN